MTYKTQEEKQRGEGYYRKQKESEVVVESGVLVVGALLPLVFQRRNHAFLFGRDVFAFGDYQLACRHHAFGGGDQRQHRLLLETCAVGVESDVGPDGGYEGLCQSRVSGECLYVFGALFYGYKVVGGTLLPHVAHKQDDVASAKVDVVGRFYNAFGVSHREIAFHLGFELCAGGSGVDLAESGGLCRGVGTEKGEPRVFGVLPFGGNLLVAFQDREIERGVEVAAAPETVGGVVVGLHLVLVEIKQDKQCRYADGYNLVNQRQMF